ncbi:methanogenic corrinoid protein MtbC1 [Bacillus mesophilus]|uniref:MerR family transcriptional regulator n=1 Tax=Bacillus mesophilus TaxID=1808955 RepID=A0A6M0Q697_9BACI|nr:cobalamin-dependent protein [Bacillus mesophilus]MBM7661216.1 methanogenic corrinoid protein MtbC1 [Bacillus mesophilus]NEY71259.1 MerR family transcriptional regulator [Bacillus mesophilus]
MVLPEGKYNIKAVSQMLGVQAGTLRAWERRYRIIAPVRNEAGHRLYTEEHVKILKWLIQKVNKGFTISQAINLLENSGLVNDTGSQPLAEGGQDRELAEKLVNSLLQFNENQAHEYLNHAFSLYSIDKVAIDILGTVLVQVGELWEKGKITSAHEHFTSSFLRSRIGHIMYTLPTNSYLPKVLAVCGPNESHELGLLIFTLYIRKQGFEVIYLGSSIENDDFDVVIEQIKPKFLFLSCTMIYNLVETLSLVDRLKADYKDIEIGLGGHAVSFLESEKREQYAAHLLGSTREEWDSWLDARLK